MTRYIDQLTLTGVITRLVAALAALFAIGLAAGGTVIPAAAEAAANSPRFMAVVILAAALRVLRGRWRVATQT